MYDQWTYSQIHQQDMLRQSQQARLATAVLGKRRSLLNRALARLGGLMVEAGQALHARYAPRPPAVPYFPVTAMPNRSVADWYVGDNRCECESSQSLRPPNGLFANRALRRHGDNH